MSWIVSSLSSLSSLAKRASAAVERRTDPDQVAFRSLEPEGPVRGRCLLAHVVESFLVPAGASVPASHPHYGEALEMAAALLDLGFVVDVISYRNSAFRPRHRYDLLVSARVNFESLARRVNGDCVKVVHLDTSHWLSNNAAALRRALEVQSRRGVTLDSVRLFEKTWAIEHADYATLLGNATTYATYAFARKPVFRLPNPAVALHPAPEGKDFGACRTHFLWLGSRGFIHKGLDVTLEAFAAMPDLTLTVCGPFDAERRFCEAFRSELTERHNVQARGWIDVASVDFRDLASRTVALVYPSCAEGCAGAVVAAMQAGLIPIVTPESGVDVDESMGVCLAEISAAAVARAVRRIAATPSAALGRMALRAWTHARETHTRERYRAAFRATIEAILAGRYRGVVALIDVAETEAPVVVA